MAPSILDSVEILKNILKNKGNTFKQKKCKEDFYSLSTYLILILDSFFF